MIPSTDEDRLKSRIYRQLDSVDSKLDYTEYVKLCRSRYEQEKYSDKKSKFNIKTTLEEELVSLAYSYYNSLESSHRRIDARALKTIKKHNKCSGRDPVVVHFFRVYNDIKRSVADLLAGSCYIEDCLEDYTNPEIIVLGDKLSTSLEDQLVKLAEEYNNVSEDKKRKIDIKAFQMIKRCRSCRNSLSMTRANYRYYYHMTGRGRKKIQEECNDSKRSTGS